MSRRRSRWLVMLDAMDVEPRYLRQHSGWTHDVIRACVRRKDIAEMDALWLRHHGWPLAVAVPCPPLDAHACLAADPPTQPAQALGEPTAHGTR